MNVEKNYYIEHKVRYRAITPRGARGETYYVLTRGVRRRLGVVDSDGNLVTHYVKGKVSDPKDVLPFAVGFGSGVTRWHTLMYIMLLDSFGMETAMEWYSKLFVWAPDYAIERGRWWFSTSRLFMMILATKKVQQRVSV